MSWRPAAREPDLVEDAIARAIRAYIMPHVSLEDSVGEGRAIGLADGRQLRLSLRAEAVRREAYAARDAIIYQVDGHAVVERTSGGVATERLGYQLSGSAVLDVKTQAFLLVEHRLTPVGTVGR